MTAYYNEIDPKAAAWLREMILRDLIAPGDVDTRSIEDVKPDDLRPYTQCHFFAGIGVWSYGLRLARWPDDRPVWTGSCPCQPFSAAGKGGGFADERHLWPAQFHLIRECRPDVWFGEQVASKDGLGWLDALQADLEGAGYAVGALDTCSAGFGAPHIRQRLRIAAQRLDHADSRQRGRVTVGEGRLSDGAAAGWIEGDVFGMADATHKLDNGAGGGGSRRGLEHPDGGAIIGLEHGASNGRIERGSEPSGRGLASGCGAGRLDDDDDDDARLEGRGSGHRAESGRIAAAGSVAKAGEPCGLADPDGGNAGAEWQQRSGEQRLVTQDSRHGELDHERRPGPVNGFWRDADWLFCRDGKWRPVVASAQSVVDGVAAGVVRGSNSGLSFPLERKAEACVARLRGYGNADMLL